MKPSRRATGRRALPRPGDERCRMLAFGPGELGDVELLALLLGGNDPSLRAVTLLDGIGGLLALDRAPVQQLARIPGVGEAGAIPVVAALELGRRVAALPVPYARTIEGPADVAAFLRAAIGSAPQEVFVALGLDVHQRLQVVRTVAMGSLCSVHVHPREVFRPMVQAGMHAVIVAHNHPSGEAEPSAADESLTRRLAAVGEAVGIPVLDHIVVTRHAVVSLAARGLLASPFGK